MVSRWYSTISDFDDIIAFQNHFWEVNADAGQRGIALCEREFPASLHVTGRAYFVMKEKVLLNRERQKNIVWGMILGLFGGSGSVASGVASQTFGLLWEGWEDRKNEVRKAAGMISLSYYDLRNDTGTTMDIDYVHDSDNMWEHPPQLY